MAPELPTESTPFLGNGNGNHTNGNGNHTNGIVNHTNGNVNHTNARQARVIGGPPTPPSKRPVDISSSELALIIGFPYFGVFLAAIDITMTSTTSASIASDFEALDIIAWLGTAYLAANAAVQPLSGKLTDIFGRRAGMILSLVFFAVGNLMCGLAQSKAMIILGRVVAGLGGGGMVSISTFITTDLIPLKKRGLWQGIYEMIFAMGIGLGGVFGGVVNDTFGWRWAFIALAPATMIAALGICFTMGAVRQERDAGSLWEKLKRIDFPGAATLVLALAVLIVGLNSQEESSSSMSLAIVLPVSLVLFVLFALIEARYASEPVVEISLLKKRSVIAACISAFLLTSAMHTLLFYVPLFLQVRGFSTSEVGLQLIAEPAGAAIASLATGLAMRFIGGYGILKPITLLAFLGAPAGFSASNLSTPVWATEVYLFLMGGGFGSALSVILVALLSTITQDMQAVATGTLYAFRTVGATLGLAVSSILLRVRLTEELDKLSSSNAHLLLSEMPDSISRLCDASNNAYLPDVCEAYGHALHTVFLLALAFAATGFAFGMLIRNESLSQTDEVTNDGSALDEERPSQD